MNATLATTVASLALLDAMNPFTVAAQAYLLGTPRPLRRATIFLLTTFAVYWAGGVVLTFGGGLAIRSMTHVLPSWAFPALEALAGAGMMIAALWILGAPRQKKAPRIPDELSLGATAVFAASSTLADLTSALPYFAATVRIATAVEDTAGRLVMLVFYNVLYCAPLIGLLVGYCVLQSGSRTAFFGRMRTAVNWLFSRALVPLLAMGSLVLICDAVRRVLHP